jgi:restriction system protein
MSNRRWFKTISNSYLGTTKVIRGTTKAEVERQAALQLSIWAQQEAKKRTANHARLVRETHKQAAQAELRALEAQAIEDTKSAEERLEAVQQLLVHGIRTRRSFRWDDLKQLKPYPPFQYHDAPPTYEQVAQSHGVPTERPIMESIFGSVRAKRLEAEAKARAQHEAVVKEHEARRASAWQAYEQQRQAYERGRTEYNNSIDARRKSFEEGEAEAIIWFVEKALKGLALPEGYGEDSDVSYDAASHTVEVDMQLPSPEEMPRVTGYKFVKTRKAIDAIELKPKELEALYDSLLYQITLLTINRIFQEAYSPSIESVVFNGWVTGIDKKTGNDFTSCVISVRADRKQFQSLQLDRVDPKECVRSLKGLVAGSLAQLAPVMPIMDLNREDKRFVESREVLANLNSIDNLAIMDWEDFEHLIRELFEKAFGDNGAEVRVTRASHDQGVDAIVFDPDPIRGGKYVIQAKRYNNVVPVSAVRDLYGTMISEGAVKGILVTTSYFGKESRDFAQDKPIKLMDGPELAGLFQQHGYTVRIELK